MNNDQLIQGAGGGGKGGGGAARVAVEATDSLRSRQYARVLDLVAEGEIEGLVNGAQSIYLDDTPLQNPNGTYNFQGVSVATRTGTQTQDHIPGFSAVEKELAVGVEVKASTAATRQISDLNANAARITLSIPQLSRQNTTTGDLNGASVQIAIDVQSNGGGFVQALVDTFSGKTMSRYQRSYRIPLTGPGPWDIRVRRITADSTSAALQNKTFWDSYTEIIDNKLRYPNSALIGISIDAAQFSAIPRRGYDLKLLKIRVPSNYNPITRAYTGAWDGTFKVAWSDNPSWCWYDLVTNSRYGLGEFVPESAIDKWALYSIGQYCDALVPNGFGGVEPRFTCNVYLQTREEAYKAVNSLASIFRAITYTSAGAITAVQDAPTDPIALFTAANVADGVFQYAGSALKARHTVAKVTWNDPADGYRQRIEYVEDHEGISRFGVVESEFVAVGCTSRGQAHRIGKWLLYSERMETEVISFKTGLEGAAVYPGAVIKTIDPHRAGKRHGGRVLAATTTVVDLDAAVEIESGATYTLSVMLPDGSIEDRAISNEPGPASTLTPATPFSAAPQTHAIWVLAASNLAAETWRVLTVREADKASVEISALKYYPQKYAYVEQGIDFEPPTTTAITLAPAPVSDIKIFEALYLAALGVVGTRATVSWSSNAARYKVEWRIGNENWQAKESIESSLDIDGLTPGVYEFRITPIDGLGHAYQATTIVHELHGKLAPPVDVSSLSIQAAGGLAVLTWAQHPDLDVRVGGRIHFRHSDSMVGATWQSSVSIGEAVPGGATLAVMPLKPGTYLAKAEDSSTVFSLTAASVSTKQASVLDFIPATSVQEDDEFSGAHSGTVGFDGILKLMADATVDDVPDLDALSSFDISGGVHATGTYTFAAGMDLGNVTRCRLTSLIRADTINVNDLIDTRASTVDDWGDFDGTANADCDAWVDVRETDDNPAETPDWSDWRRLDASEYAARAFQFRAQLASNDPAFNIHITHLRVSAQTLA